LAPFFWQRLNQVFQHASQAPVDLDARAAKVTDFGDGQLDEVFPARRPIEERNPSFRRLFLRIRDRTLLNGVQARLFSLSSYYNIIPEVTTSVPLDVHRRSGPASLGCPNDPGSSISVRGLTLLLETAS
jgi:hypothetical protein